MTVRRKADAAEIRAFLEALKTQRWLGRAREAWPHHLYHFSDVANVAEILRRKRVYSRNRLTQLGIDTVDIARAEVIHQSQWAHRYARFYFRPRTPTQYHNEGIRAPDPDGRPLDAHCPVPVFLLFDSVGMLTRAGCSFTDGNFARHRHAFGDDLPFLRALPFRHIYHNEPIGRLSPEDKDEIVRTRCAEVVFPDEVDLDDLRAVVCRTPAERETLLTLLGPELARCWRAMVRTEGPAEELFFRERAYVREVRLVDDDVRIHLVCRAGTYPYQIVVRTRDGDERHYSGEQTSPFAEWLRVGIGTRPEKIFAQVTLAGCLAYRGYPSQQTLF